MSLALVAVVLVCLRDSAVAASKVWSHVWRRRRRQIVCHMFESASCAVVWYDSRRGFLPTLSTLSSHSLTVAVLGERGEKAGWVKMGFLCCFVYFRQTFGIFAVALCGCVPRGLSLSQGLEWANSVNRDASGTRVHGAKLSPSTALNDVGPTTTATSDPCQQSRK